MKKNIILIAMFVLLVFICFIIMFTNKGKTANIYIDGTLVKSIDLSKVKTDMEIQIGNHNTVMVKKGSIRMYDADCPDRLCIKQGEIFDGTYPIVCLPNKVVIRINDE